MTIIRYYFTAAGTCTYNANGALATDSGRGISSVTWNEIDLPQTVTFSNGSSINYYYAADGTKLREVRTVSGTATTIDWCGDLVLEKVGNGTRAAKRLRLDGGYVDLATGVTARRHFVRDHLGSVRAVVNDSGTVLETDDYYPLGGPLPTGSNTALQPEKYQGKEWNPAASFNVYDFGARLYDPALGRWLSQDPLAEKYYPHSPYIFCAGNPMNAVDKDGLFPIWPIIFALADYGMQVSDNYNQGLRGYDMLLGEINVAEVILSAVPVSKGSTIAQLGKTFAKEAFKAGIKYTPNDKFDVNENVSDVLSRAIISTTADAAVGRLLEFGSEAATTAAKKASEGAAKKAIHDANIAANRSRSTVRATRAETSQGVAHVARADYLERKIVNGTLVKAPELTKMAASTTAEKVYEIIDPLSVDKSGYFYLTGFGK